jgi:hypothetical protein
MQERLGAKAAGTQVGDTEVVDPQDIMAAEAITEDIMAAIMGIITQAAAVLASISAEGTVDITRRIMRLIIMPRPCTAITGMPLTTTLARILVFVIIGSRLQFLWPN